MKIKQFVDKEEVLNFSPIKTIEQTLAAYYVRPIDPEYEYIGSICQDVLAQYKKVIENTKTINYVVDGD